MLQQLQISWAKIKLFCDSLTRKTTRWWSGKIIIGNVWQQPKQEYSLWCEIMFNTFWLFYWMIKTDPSSSLGFKKTLLQYLCKTCPFFMNLRYRLELFCKPLSSLSLFAFPFKNYQNLLGEFLIVHDIISILTNHSIVFCYQIFGFTRAILLKGCKLWLVIFHVE